MKKIQHIIEAAIANFLLIIFGALPFAATSAVGGFLARKIGPHLKVTKLARRNIKLAFPNFSEEKIDEVIIGMWDNLGRTMFEYSHMNQMTLKQIYSLVEIKGQENLDALIKSEYGFLMTGHFANWEMIATTAYQHECPLHIVYRKANNPYIDKIIRNIRKHYQTSSSPKGSVGARQIIKALQSGIKIAMLVDQKQNDGIAVPFFGIDAMTAPAIATLALKYNASIFPARIVRFPGPKFQIVFGEPIKITKTGNNEADIFKLMSDINILLEGWVREYPEQWFWVHNRWPKDARAA